MLLKTGLWRSLKGLSYREPFRNFVHVYMCTYVHVYMKCCFATITPMYVRRLPGTEL
jgi:hypothetical protein